MALSERDKAILDLERCWWKDGGTKADAIRVRLGISATRYYEVLRRLADSADAYLYDPLVVRRLRAGRDARRRARFEGPVHHRRGR